MISAGVKTVILIWIFYEPLQNSVVWDFKWVANILMLCFGVFFGHFQIHLYFFFSEAPYKTDFLMRYVFIRCFDI